MKIKLTVCYDGTDYCGWQVQPNKRTAQGVLIEGIEKLTGEKVKLVGSGRTDAGVHAMGQVASFSTNSTIPAEKFYFALNTILPPDIKVLKSERVDDKFDASRSAKRKTYKYSVYVSDAEIPLKERYSVRVNKNIDFSAMEKASELFIGEHDFKSFCASKSGAKTSVRKIYDFKVEQNGIDILFTVTGNGFLYNMVRIMVGTLIKVGYNKIDGEQIKKMLDGGGRNLGGDTIPAKGLCLMNVEYE